MGTWGKKPFDSDCAADWAHEMHETTGLRDWVVATLRAGVRREGAGGVRAAAAVLAALGKTYSWPVHSIESDVRLAIGALLQARECYRGPRSGKVRREVTAEIAVLKRRLNKAERRRRQRERAYLKGGK